MTTNTDPRPPATAMTLTAFLREMPWGTHVDLGRYEHPHQGCWGKGAVSYEDGPVVFEFHITDRNELTRATVSEKAVYGDVTRYRRFIERIGEAR